MEKEKALAEKHSRLILEKTGLVYGKLLLTEASPYFARLPPMLSSQFSKSSEEIKAMRDAAQRFIDGSSEFKYDVKNVDKLVKVAEKNNDMINTIMSKCVG